MAKQQVKDDAPDRLIDQVIEAMFDVLPANTSAEIAAKLTKRMKRPIVENHVRSALSVVRKNPFDYEYTVPFVKGGTPREGDTGRYFAVLVNRKDKTFEITPDVRRHFQAGQVDNAKGMGTSAHCAVAMCREYARYENSAVRKQMWNDIADDYEYASRKIKALVRVMVPNQKAA